MLFFRHLDDIWASVEKVLTFLVLLSMVLVAGLTVIIRNLCRINLTWFGTVLMQFDWADSFLRKATVWLAFLGASLAVYYSKHINIDALVRFASPRTRYAMRATSNLLASVVAVGLTYAFSHAVHANLTERPLEYEILAESGQVHICDASSQTLQSLNITDRPKAFCAIRNFVGFFNVPAESPGAAAQLIVPIMLFIIALRLFGHGVRSIVILSRGNEAIAEAEAEEAQRAAEEAQSVDAAERMKKNEERYR